MTALLLAAVLAVDPAAPASITLSAGHCYGPCPVYSVTVSADGEGVFTGVDHVAQTGERRFRITPAEYRAFAAHVAPLASAGCASYITHAGPVGLLWRGADGSLLQRRLYTPCLDRRAPALAARLRDAAALLPIGDFIRAPR